jgi:hypothetical protein
MTTTINASTTAGLVQTADTSGILQLQTNGTAAVTVDASQNVGIGTSSPDGKLDIESSLSDQLFLTRAGVGNYSFGVGASNALQISNSGTERMRIDSSGNLLFNSGYGSVATAFGCRAWVNFDGTGTPAIRASGNVTSITDNATGDYTLNLTTALTDIKYSVAGFVNESGRIVTGRGVAFTTSAIRIGSYVASSQTLEDQSVICVAVFR